MSTLYEITGEYMQALARLADMDLPPEAVFDTVESLQGDLEAKAEAIVRTVRNFEAAAACKNDECKRLAEQAEALERKAENLSSYLQGAIEAVGVSLPFRAGPFALNLAKTPRTVRADLGRLPPEWVRSTVVIKGCLSAVRPLMNAIHAALESSPTGVEMSSTDAPDLRAIGAALKDDVLIDGASLSQQGRRLTIR